MIKLIALWVVCVCSANSAKILGIFMTSSYSHQIVFQPIWKELSLQGHQVTVITPNPLKDPTLVNLTEIDISEMSYRNSDNFIQEIYNLKHHNFIADLMLLGETYLNLSNIQLQLPEFQELIHNSSKYHFDLFLVEYFIPAMYPFKDIFNCPMVGIVSFPMPSSVYSNLGMPYHPIMNPELTLPYSRDLFFIERVYSVLFKIGTTYIIKPIINYKMQQIVTKYFGTNTRYVEDIARDVSLVLVNDNLAIQSSKLTVPAYVPISGIHIKPAQPLPDDLRRILDESKQGVIYVSFGSHFKIELCANGTINKLINVFKKLPYTILWKYEISDISRIPSNVKIQKWFPQQDVLGHPNVKLFITQGGYQSLDESIHRQVPVLVLPYFGDQRHNADRMTKIGAGLHLDFYTFTEDDFYTKINTIVTDPKYKTNMIKLSAIASDQPMKALDKAVWYINYVLRHNGAKHLRYKALDLPWYSYELLDVYCFLLAVTAVIFYLLKIVYQILFLNQNSKFREKKKIL